MPKVRLDLLLVERGLAESRAKAQALVMAGQVRVDGQVSDRSASNVPADANVIVDKGPRFVSRGGGKLEAALLAFPIEIRGRTCADVGASTGGFTDCLLQHGAAKVYTVEVGKGILHWKIRSDARVVVMEETNARYVESLPEPVSLVTIDASFISLKILLPVVKGWLQPSPPTTLPKLAEAGVIALVKPQFEAGRKESARHKGVIRDPQVHKAILADVLTFAEEQGFGLRGLVRSPVVGPKGNVEFLAWLGMGGAKEADLAALVQEVVGE
jgi:23S rRNA (cytidine1920-2'-O)/16S rRNA (cytidine1409-2'-O)-methyltransferase